MELGLVGTVALVGGSSRGIGLAIAEAFVHEGARVVLTGRDADALEHARAGIASRNGHDAAIAVAGDLGDPRHAQRCVEVAAEAGEALSVVANAGSGAAQVGFELAEADWRNPFDVNLFPSALLATAALRRLTAAGGGSLTFVGSIAGLEATDAPLAYGAAKAALTHAAKSLSRLGGPHGVRVNVVAPGNVLFPGGTWERKLKEDRESVEQRIRDEVPLQRFARPEEIAAAVVFLASRHASFITGACLVVDGGQTRSL